MTDRARPFAAGEDLWGFPVEQALAGQENPKGLAAADFLIPEDRLCLCPAA